MAVCVAVESLPQDIIIDLYSDSEYVVNTINGAYRMRKNEDLWDRIIGATMRRKLRAHWVAGHKGNPFNERCDELATMAMSCGSSLPPDTGYEAEKERGREFFQRVDRLAEVNRLKNQDIILPEKYARKSIVQKPKDYASDHRVHESCAKALISFAHEYNPSFKSYLNLRTGGCDAWSNMRAEAIVDELADGAEAYDLCRKYLPTDKDATSALRWFARGLPLEHCIRKVWVDLEVSANCAG